MRGLLRRSVGVVRPGRPEPAEVRVLGEGRSAAPGIADRSRAMMSGSPCVVDPRMIDAPDDGQPPFDQPLASARVEGAVGRDPAPCHDARSKTPIRAV